MSKTIYPVNRRFLDDDDPLRLEIETSFNKIIETRKRPAEITVDVLRGAEEAVSYTHLTLPTKA